ncbi:MAG: ATPase [Candidatus Omnitrophica bacterium CG11_big_fil_rev_8_21_14_0_20_63_9]|nr:MAG: ATPase [Candidatus Omnitrophica bacterium CG11_big_fil_rev_8_21_14_0_20_63_9]
MYESFFGLKEKPFSMTPDPRYFYPSAKHTDALNHMVYAIEERRGFVVITGEIGSGKTTLSRVLFQKLDRRTKTAVIRNTQLSAKDLVAQTLDELEIPYKPSSTKAGLINALNEFLVEQLGTDSNVVLLIDEAQNLKPNVLEEVRMLSNLETEREKLIQIILMGQPELKSKLWLKELTQLRQRVTLHYHLAPLDEPESAAYITHRLHVAGANGTPLFSSSALPKIFQYTQGVPRLINGLCDRALLTGYVNESKTIDAGIIAEVAGELPSLTDEPISA